MKRTLEGAIGSLKQQLLHFYGYDANLNYVGKRPKLPKAVPTRLGPRDFLSFAVKDLENDSQTRGLVNCLANCKRALDSQVDFLIHKLGYSALARRQRWNVPRKLEFISQAGVVAPRILQRISALRNKLEHEYKMPSKSQVEDALDVAMLFVSYSEVVSIPSLNWTLPDGLSVNYNSEKMTFLFVMKGSGESEVDLNLKLTYGDASFDDLYPTWPKRPNLAAVFGRHLELFILGCEHGDGSQPFHPRGWPTGP